MSFGAQSASLSDGEYEVVQLSQRTPLVLPGVSALVHRSREEPDERRNSDPEAQSRPHNRRSLASLDLDAVSHPGGWDRQSTSSSVDLPGQRDTRRWSHSINEDETGLDRMAMDMNYFMECMADEPDTLKTIVSRGQQAWDMEELKPLKTYMGGARGLPTFRGPVKYQWPRPVRKNKSLKDQIFTPLGLEKQSGSDTTEQEDDEDFSSPCRQAHILRDSMVLGDQVLTEFSLIHLAVSCPPDQARRHLSQLIEANADVNAIARCPSSSLSPSPAAMTSNNSVFNLEMDSPREEGAFVSIQAIHMAVSISATEVVSYLLHARASPDTRATFDMIPDFTALHLAVAIAKERGSKVVQGQEPTRMKSFQAEQTRNAAHEVIRLLLAAGADVRAVDLSATSALSSLCSLDRIYRERWMAELVDKDRERLSTSLDSGPPSEMDVESAVFNGLVVRLPDPQETSESLQTQWKGRSSLLQHAQEHDVGDLSRLSKREFRVCNVVPTAEHGLMVECQMVSCGFSGTRTRRNDELQIFRFPRYLGAARKTRAPSKEELRLEAESFVGHIPSASSPRKRISRRRAWQTQGVIVQGYQHFEVMLDQLRDSHIGSEAAPVAKRATSIKRGSTQPLPDGPSEGDNGSLPKAGRNPSKGAENLPPRPHTSTGVLAKSRTVGFTANPFKTASSPCGDVNMVLDMPLPPGARYKKSWIFKKGCLIHYVTYLVIKTEEEGPVGGLKVIPEKALDDLQLVIDAHADVHARAYYVRGGTFCTTTALHMVAASAACMAAAAVMLLRAKASIEVMSTMNGMPYYHPLHNAAYCGSTRLTKLLLKERANPNSVQNEGRTSLHLAVKQNHIEVVRLLVEAKGNVVMTDRRLSGHRSGLTPLDMCRRAMRQYSPSERAEIMVLLAPSFNGVNSLLFDLHHLAMTSDGSIGGFLVDQALKLKSPVVQQAVAQLKAHAVEEHREPCQHEECRLSGIRADPVDYLSSILENAPMVGVQILMTILLNDPDQEDTVRGALPPRANLKPRHQDSWLPWRRSGWFVTPFLCAYEPDSNRDRKDREMMPNGREDWPCWLHSEDNPDPPWHKDLAPQPGTQGRRVGDADVHIRVLLLANAIDVRILRAFARVSRPDIFAEVVVQAIIGCTFDQVASGHVHLLFAEEAILFLLFTQWEKVKANGHWWGRGCWCATSAIVIKEILVHTYSLVRHSWTHRWPVREFFLTNTWSHTFKLLRLIVLSLMVLKTRRDYCVYDPNLEDSDAQYPRKLLGANIVIQGLQIVLLLRNASPEAEFGRHILSILHSFGRLWAILLVMICFFLSFSFAFYVMDDELSYGELLERVYRGLLLGDGDGLDFMEGRSGHNVNGESSSGGHKIEWFLSCLSTFLFTICLLNISIAVFQTEYDKALRESYLHFWQHRAFLCMQTLLGPRWPWGTAELSPRLRSAVDTFKDAKKHCVNLCQRYRRKCHQVTMAEDEAQPMVLKASEKDEDAQIVFWTGVFCFALSFFAAVAFFMVSALHAIFSAFCMGFALFLLQALLVRNEALSAHHEGKKFFLWICHRADFNPRMFLEEDVEKDDITELKGLIGGGLADLRQGIQGVSLEMGRRMEKLEASLGELQRKVNTTNGSATSAKWSLAVKAAVAEANKLTGEVEASAAPQGPGGLSTAPWSDPHEEDTLEWAAAYHHQC